MSMPETNNRSRQTIPVVREAITGDTITDAQIRELLREAEAHGYPGSDPKWREQWIAADVALHDLHTFNARESVKYKARVRCADIINTRNSK